MAEPELICCTDTGSARLFVPRITPHLRLAAAAPVDYTQSHVELGKARRRRSKNSAGRASNHLRSREPWDADRLP